MNKTAFVTHNSLYRSMRMPFGLENMPATFQLAMDVILGNVKDQYALIYIDDIILFSSTQEDHIRQVKIVSKLVQEAGMALKLKSVTSSRTPSTT